MAENVIYIVNKNSTTSIPLEVAGKMENKNNIYTVAYYKNEDEPIGRFTNKVYNIGAKGLFDLRAIYNSFNLIHEINPKIIHGHHTFSAFLFFILGKIFYPSSKLIKTEHNDHRYFKWYQTVVNFFILSMADVVLCNSQSTLDSFSLLEKKITQGQTEVCYNGVDIKSIQSIKLSALDRNKIIPSTTNSIVIGSVGRFVEQKDYSCLIEAYNIVLNKLNIDIKLVLVGDGKLKYKLKNKVEELDLSDHVIFTGLLDRHFVYGVLNEIDIFVVTSKWEGFCNALVEALAAKKAVVCSNINTLKEVADGSALFGEVGMPDTFANQMMRLVNDEELKKRMESKAEKRSKKFSLEACAKRYLDYYKLA